MAATPVVPVAHVSWLKRVGHFFGSILKVLANDGAAAEKAVEPALLALFPQWSAMILAGDALATKILKGVAIAETTVTGIQGAAQGAEAKLNAVVGSIGPDIDAWIAAALPGSATLSQVAKSGIVNAFVFAFNEVAPPNLAITLPTTPAPKV